MNVRAGSQRRKFRCNASPTGVPIVSDWVTTFEVAAGGGTGLGTKTLRQILPIGYVDTGTKYRLTYRCGTSVLNLTNAYMQSQAPSGDVYDFSTTPAQILFGGAAGYNFAIGESKLTDEIVLTTTSGTAPLVIATAMGAVGGMTAQTMGGAANYTIAGSDAATVDATGYALNTSNLFTGQIKIEQYQTSLAGFPFVRGVTQGQSSSAVSSLAVTNPTGVTAGDVLLLIVGNDGNQAPGITGTGWSTIYAAGSVSSSCGAGVFWKIADGNDAVTITLGVADDLGYNCYRIYGATSVSGTAATPAVPVTFVAHTPAGGSKKYLWIAALGLGLSTDVNAIPAGWTGLRTRADGSGSGVGSWQKYLEASTITPGAYTTTSVNQGVHAITIAVAQ